MKRCLSLALLAGILSWGGTSLSGAAPAGEKKTYTTQRLAQAAPVIDGALNDPAWETVPWGDSFTQEEPQEGRAPQESTRFKILYDDDFLYIAVRAADSAPQQIARRVSRRDQIDGDWVGIYIDSYHDRRTAFVFQVNAAGVRNDKIISNDGGNEDGNWDPVWWAVSRVDDQGWTSEMAIPLNQLRFSNGDSERVWGLQVTRRLFRLAERSNWQHIPRSSASMVGMYGELRGLNSLHPKREFRLLPYAVAQTDRAPAESGNPFATGHKNSLMLGLDGKIGVTNDVTLDFTVNPDFGQVEADPSEINLTTFETFFQEKRPFFIEGKDILNFRITGGDGTYSSDTPFYSRRVGRPPQGEPRTAAGEFVDLPEHSTILGAVKLTGKSRGGLSLGLLDAVTARENAVIDKGGQRREAAVEPLTNFMVLRVQKDMRNGDTTIGGIVTAVNRKLAGTGLNFLHRAAYSAAVDFRHTWSNRTYYIGGRLVGSSVSGDKEALLATQMSPRHYFQRPDADYVRLDPNRTSLFGHGGTFNAGREGNSGLRYSVSLTWRSPGLELNDAGYLRTADVIMQSVWANYRWLNPIPSLRELSVNANQWQGWNFGGEPTFGGGNVGFNLLMQSYWSVDFGINPQGRGLSTSALRGGPALRVPAGCNYWFSLTSDERRPLVFDIGVNHFAMSECDKTSWGFSTTVIYRPSNRLSLSVKPFYQIENHSPQYVANADSAAGPRYIRGELDQKTAGMTIRLNFSLTPDLSIQFYGQPFLSTGIYRRFGRVVDPRADTYLARHHFYLPGELQYDPGAACYQVDENGDGRPDYSYADPNFKFLEFRSNLVVCWEYHPGSAVYLVWSQSRSGNPQARPFDIGDDMQDLLHLPARNIFLVKFTHRF